MNSDVLTVFADMMAAAGLGTVGTNIFIGQLPAEINGIYLVRLGGTMNNYLPIEETLVDVYIQNINAQTAVQTAETIKRTFHRHLETGSDEQFIYTILALSNIDDLGRDQEYGKMYKITFEIEHRATAIIS